MPTCRAELPENQYPTIADLHEYTKSLMEDGLGALPVQVLIVPDGTLDVIARLIRRREGLPEDDRPALMVEAPHDEASRRSGVLIASAERLGAIPTTATKVQ